MSALRSARHLLAGLLVCALVLLMAWHLDSFITVPFIQLGATVARLLGIDEKAMGFRYHDYTFLTPKGALVYSIPTAVILGLITIWFSKKASVQTRATPSTDAGKEA